MTNRLKGVRVALWCLAGASVCPLQAQTAPTFWDDIYPITQQNCAACHHADGSAPFSLESYEEVSRQARTALAAVESGYMPPWLPKHGFGDFEGARGLNAQDRATLAAWVAGGRPEGTAPESSVTQNDRTAESPERAPDLVASFAQPYELGADGEDEFRSFLLDAKIKETRWVEKVRFRIPNKRIVHHATLRLDRSGTFRSLQEREGQNGLSGMDSGFAGEMPEGQLVGWTPGRSPDVGDPEIPWLLESGTDLILEMHMLPSGKLETVEVELEVFFASAADIQRRGIKKPTLLHLAGGYDIQIPAGESEYLVVDSYQLPVSVDVLAIYPHAHYLARSIESFARLPDGSIEWLLRIPSWDFNWQDVYRFAQPVALPAGSVVSTRFAFDNSSQNPRNPHAPPEDVHYGPHSSDEMADLYLQVLPQNPRDLPALVQDHGRKEVLARIAGLRKRLKTLPDDGFGHNTLGTALAATGRVEEAAFHFREAVRSTPDFVDPLYNLGVYYSTKGDAASAARMFEQALTLNADHAESYAGLGVSLFQRGELAAAEERLQRAVDLKPGLTIAHHYLGRLYSQQQRMDLSERHQRDVIAQRPEWPEGPVRLGTQLAALGRYTEAIELFERALQLDPNHVEAQQSLDRAKAALDESESSEGKTEAGFDFDI